MASKSDEEVARWARSVTRPIFTVQEDYAYSIRQRLRKIEDLKERCQSCLGSADIFGASISLVRDHRCALLTRGRYSEVLVPEDWQALEVFAGEILDVAGQLKAWEAEKRAEADSSPSLATT